MKYLTSLVGLAIACAACCSASFVVPAITGIARFGAGLSVLDWEAGVAILVAAVVTGAILWIRKSRCRKADPQGAGGRCACGVVSARGGTE